MVYNIIAWTGLEMHLRSRNPGEPHPPAPDAGAAPGSERDAGAIPPEALPRYAPESIAILAIGLAGASALILAHYLLGL